MLSKLLFRLSTLARSSAQEETVARSAGERQSTRVRWIDSLSTWWRGAAANASTQSRSDATARRMAAIYLASTQPPDADTRLCPREPEPMPTVAPAVAKGRAARLANKLTAELVAARTQLSSSICDLPYDRQHDMQVRIRQAQTLRDLWHLRPQIFTMISIERDQSEARSRLAACDQHFPETARKSGFGSLG